MCFALSSGKMGRTCDRSVARAEHIHPNKFAMCAAVDAGMTADVVTTAGEAREWLLKPA